jgi:Protein of unknown function (DUF3830)
MNTSQSAVGELTTDSGVRISVAGLEFSAQFETSFAPLTCSAFREILPFTRKMIHCRWSGEGVWVPLHEWDTPWLCENTTSHPIPGQVLLYAGGPSEPELLIPYGQCLFNSKFGRLSGNHLLTIVDNREGLAELGRILLWQGAKDCTIESLRRS